MTPRTKKLQLLLLVLTVVTLVGLGLRVHWHDQYSTADELVAVARSGNQQLMNRTFREGHTRQRAEAVTAALVVQDDQAMALLQDAARDPELPLRLLLVSRVSELPSDKALVLIQIFLDDTQPGIVRDAINALQPITRENYAYDWEAPAETRRQIISTCKEIIDERIKARLK